MLLGKECLQLVDYCFVFSTLLHHISIIHPPLFLSSILVNFPLVDVVGLSLESTWFPISPTSGLGHSGGLSFGDCGGGNSG